MQRARTLVARWGARLSEALITLWLLATLCFVLLRVAPGGPFDAEKAAPPEVQAALAAQYRLDRPLLAQYGAWLGDVARGDLGPSFQYPDYTVNQLVANALPVSAGHRSALLSRFQILLDAHFRDRWSVARYVNALGTTAYLLNTATRTGLGCEASAVIHACVKTEAKRLLLYTMLNVTEIATTLGYDDSAHFSCMFRQATGLAPAE